MQILTRSLNSRRLGGLLPEGGEPARDVIDLLDRVGRRATVLSSSPRFFGFVAGGTLPVTLGAQWIAAAWAVITTEAAANMSGSSIERAARDLLRIKVPGIR